MNLTMCFPGYENTLQGKEVRSLKRNLLLEANPGDTVEQLSVCSYS